MKFGSCFCTCDLSRMYFVGQYFKFLWQRLANYRQWCLGNLWKVVGTLSSASLSLIGSVQTSRQSSKLEVLLGLMSYPGGIPCRANGTDLEPELALQDNQSEPELVLEQICAVPFLHQHLVQPGLCVVVQQRGNLQFSRGLMKTLTGHSTEQTEYIMDDTVLSAMLCNI